MLVIRFFRVGKTNQPYFKIVVTDKRRPTKGGRFVEEVGFIDPRGKSKIFKAERIKYWISVGAKPSPTVHNLLISEKIIEGKKIPKHKIVKKVEEPKPEVPKEPAESPAKDIQAGKEEPKPEAPKAEPKVEAKKEQKTETPKIETTEEMSK